MNPGWIVVGLGTCVLMLSAVGIHRLPDALSRQHAATKAATFGLGITMSGVALLHPHAEWLVRLAVLAVILLLTLPAASHALALAAIHRK